MVDLRKTLLVASLLVVASCGKKKEEPSGPISSPEIIRELDGEKNGYVGAWVEIDPHGAPAYLDIGPRGGIRYHWAQSIPPYRRDDVDGLIARFSGNDIEVTGASPGTIVVSEAPHRVGDRWRMGAMKKTFER